MASEADTAFPQVPTDYEPPRRVSEAEYLRIAEQFPKKYEYHDGLMYPRFYPPGSHWAMAGGTEAHDQIKISVQLEIGRHLRGSGRCRAHTSDMMLRAGDHDFFPDAYVTCNDPFQASRTRIEDATFICEVRSQSTAEFDRNDKFEAYKLLPSLREYLILDNRRPQATLHRKIDGAWLQITYTGTAEIALESIDLRLPLDSIYGGMPLDPDPTK